VDRLREFVLAGLRMSGSTVVYVLRQAHHRHGEWLVLRRRVHTLVACDLALAAEDAVFGLSEVNWGIPPGSVCRAH